MTRASLLHILDHVTGISDVEIRELEQLAAAFPYCQTAHVLLAKAAHDRGSMLAGQRLRRAATYATDRNLLRQLLESTAVITAAQPAEHLPLAFTAPEPTFPVEPEEAPVPGAVAADVPEALPVSPKTDTDEPLPADEQSAPQEPSATETAVAEELSTEPRPETAAIETVLTGPIITETVAPELSQEDEALFTSRLPDLAESSSDAAPAAEPAAPSAVPEPELSGPEEPVSPLPGLPEAEVENAAAEAVPESGPEPTAADDLLPAVAPPIRPPADAGISRFEFGLGQSELPAPVAYQLPELEEEDDELPTLSKLPAAPQPVVTAPFRADADLGYALGAGSRLGYDLEARDGYTLDLPLDAFFEPDALLLAHLKAHKPKPAASSLDLINRFLKTQPRIKTPAGMPLPAEQQPDLSVRSAGGAPALASESLAKIMVRQGKKDKAIEIYERLMARQPEKKAYFAEQIQQLQQHSE